MKTNSVKVEIITIGDEILIGQIVDTNSAWMAVELNKAGFELAQITSVHDDAKHIIDSLELALTRADVVLFTGGIGPTKDDITKQTLSSYFGMSLIFSDEVYQNIERVLINRSRAVNELTRTQAFVPDGCTVIQNTVGTAPITWFEKEGKVIVSMPGVPNEMKHVMSTEIIPRLSQRFETPSIIHKNVIVQGYPESALAMKIADWENALPEDIHLAYLPNYGIIKLRLSGISDDPLPMEFSINQQIAGLTEILGDAIVAFDDVPVENMIGNLLAAKGMTLATAESCTGGHIAHKITSVSGSSDYFKGSVIAYSNEVKINVLNVTADDIEQYGAVSKEVVEQMAVNIRRLLKTDVAIATSGIAGPGGGTTEKPVGTVWISVCSGSEIVTKMFKFGNVRLQNIERTTQTALLMLKEII
ncbi:MAG TPA: CinA family nicotinamide mononucleotide deamidase-related protein [Paludibacter sp.]|nr:CinA family nicotinamide mononucleotide deamidase-related protein [Paludibacter sp.]